MQFLRRLREYSPDITLIFLGAIAMCWIAFKNRYPLVYPDTGTYLFSGWDGYVPTDRPIGYGLFLKHTSMRESLWFTILFQGLITSYSIWLFIRSFVSGIAIRRFVFIAAAGLLCFASGLPIKTGIILPDIFTPVGLLFGTVLLLRTKEISRVHIVIAAFGIVLACWVHHSNAYIFAMLLVFAALMKWRKRVSFNLIEWRRIVFCAALLPVWWLTAGLVNYKYSDKFFVSRNGDIFLAGHFIHDGTMRKFLCMKCKENPNYFMCDQKDSLVLLDFLWDYNRSPLYKYGGWDNPNGAFGIICKDILTSPKMWPWLAHRALGQSAQQLLTFQLSERFESPVSDNSWPSTAGVQKFYANEFNLYSYAEQHGTGMNYDDQNKRQNWLLFFSVAAIILFLFGYRKEFPRMVQLIVFVLVAIYCNAFICGAISIVNSRYQSRVVWLLPLLALVVLAESGILSAIGSRIKQSLNRK